MSELQSSFSQNKLLRTASNYVAPDMGEQSSDYEQLKKRAREEREAQLASIANGTDDIGTTSKVDESGYIQLSYTEYNRIQQKKIDSSSNETMFR